MTPIEKLIRDVAAALTKYADDTFSPAPVVPPTPVVVDPPVVNPPVVPPVTPPSPIVPPTGTYNRDQVGCVGYITREILKTDADFDALVRKCSYIGGPYNWMIGDFKKSANRLGLSVQCPFYANISNSNWGDSPYEVDAAMIEWCAKNSVDIESLYLHAATDYTATLGGQQLSVKKGDRVPTYRAGRYLYNIANPNLAAFLIEFFKRMLALGYDSVFIDNLAPGFKSGQSGAGDVGPPSLEITSDISFDVNTLTTLNAISRAFGRDKIVANIGPYLWKQALGLVGTAFAEFILQPKATWQGNNTPSWRDRLALADAAKASGTKIIWSVCGADTPESKVHAMGMFLTLANEGDRVCWQDTNGGTLAETVYDLEGVDMGNPTAAPSLTNGVIIRSFERGLVYCSLSDATISLALPNGYEARDYNNKPIPCPAKTTAGQSTVLVKA